MGELSYNRNGYSRKEAIFDRAPVLAANTWWPSGEAVQGRHIIQAATGFSTNLKL